MQDWEYDGVNLTRVAYNVRLLGAPLSTPSRRGDNVVIPGKMGRMHVAKQLDQRVQTLAMWVTGEPVDGGTPSEAQLLANLDTLRGLFARAGQHTLRHQFGSVTRQAQVEVVNAIAFEPRSGNQAYTFVVDFVMADPLWYAATATTVGPTTITTSPKTITVANPGTYQSERAILTLAGPLTDPVLAFGSTWVQWIGAIANGQTLVIDCGAFTATLGGADVSEWVRHAGALCWLPIPAGSNTLTVTSADLGGSVTVAFYAPYV